MTISISISHDSPNADHAIVVTSESGGEQRIEPGQFAQLHIYAGNDLRVSEVALETAHEPAALQSFSLGAIGQGITGDEPTEQPAAEATVHNLNTTASLEANTPSAGADTLVDVPTPPGAGLTEPAAEAPSTPTAE